MAAASVRYAPPDPTLPKPWKGLIDGKTGYLYFWNPVTNITTYEKPVGSPERALSPKRGESTLKSCVMVDEKPCQEKEKKENRDTSNVVDNVVSDVGGNGASVDRDNDEDIRNGDHDDKPGFEDTDGGRNLEQEGLQSGGGNLNERLATPCRNGTDMHSPVINAQNSKSSASIGSILGNAPSADSYCRQHEITVIGNNVPPPFTSFQSTGFPPEILREVQKVGFSAPSPIQAQSWPIALQNHDIVAVAKTGSGKTLGYLLPGFVHIKRSGKNPQMGPTVLVLSPTRELATQIQDEAEKFGQSSNISCTCLYGGAPKGPQLKDLDKGMHVVVATPGRLNDIMEMGRISLSQVSYLVLDEADRMLDMGFEPQIRKILKEIPARRQTLMYTATWPKGVRNIASEFLKNPYQVNIGRTDELVANKSISQRVMVVNSNEKNKKLEEIVRSVEPRSKIIIFCSTKRMCDQLVTYIPRQLSPAAIHGDKSQGERDHVLNQFRNGSSPILVATDVAARGLDVKDIKVVINYDFPTGIEDYVHRIGRTGRGGATGIAYTFFCDRDAKHAKDLVKILEGANQHVPPQLRELVGGSFGMSRNFGGRGGRGSSENNYGGRGFGGDRNRSRSPPKKW